MVTPATAPASERSGLSVAPGSALEEEALAPLVNRILQPPDAHASRSLLFTTIAPDPERGGPVCAAAADMVAARTTKAVCVVDVNLRSPGLHRFFGIAAARGWSDLLLDGSHGSRYVRKVGANLWMMPAGLRCAEALRCLGGEEISAQVSQLVSLFDHVLLDTAAAGLYNDVIALGACVDGVVLVIDANATRRQVAKRAAETLRAANARLFGAVLTNRSFPIPESIYRRL